MHKGRLEAFTDAVIAIILTIMVLEFRAPSEASFAALSREWLTFVAYGLSFVFLAIYWNNHHHMLQLVERVNGSVLWANMHLLFWLSFTPFVTKWMSETDLSKPAVATYGIVLLLSAIAYYILQSTLLKANGAHSRFARALGSDYKGKISPLLYVVAVIFAYIYPYFSCCLYVLVALIWLVPDKRFERAHDHGEQEPAEQQAR